MNIRRALGVSAVFCAAGLALALTGCKKEPTEPAPIQDGQFLKYRFDNRDAFSEGTITFNKDGEGWTMSIQPPAPDAPAKLDPELRQVGESRVKLHTLGMFFLPPRSRQLDATTPVGRVAKTRKFQRWDVYTVADRGGAGGDRFYDVSTGFLVGMENRNSGLKAALVGSNIPGL